MYNILLTQATRATTITWPVRPSPAVSGLLASHCRAADTRVSVYPGWPAPTAKNVSKKTKKIIKCPKLYIPRPTIIVYYNANYYLSRDVWFRSRVWCDQILLARVQRQELVPQHTADRRPPEKHPFRDMVRDDLRNQHGAVAVQRTVLHRTRGLYFRLPVGRPRPAHLRLGKRQDEYHVRLVAMSVLAFGLSLKNPCRVF